MKNGTIVRNSTTLPSVLCSELYAAEIQEEKQTGQIGFYTFNFYDDFTWICPDTRNITILNNEHSYYENHYNQSIIFSAEVYQCEEAFEK